MQGTTGDRTARETCKHTLPHLPTSPLFHQPAITLIPYLHLSTSIHNYRTSRWRNRIKSQTSSKEQQETGQLVNVPGDEQTCRHTLPHLPTCPLFHQPAITLTPYLHLSTSIKLPDNQVQEQNQEPSSDE